MGPQRTGHTYLVGDVLGLWAPREAHLLADRGKPLSFALCQTELHEDPRQRLVSPAGRQIASAQTGQGTAGRQGARRMELDSTGEDRDARGIVQAIVAVGENVAEGLLQCPHGVPEVVGPVRVRLVHHQRRLLRHQATQRVGLLRKRARQLVPLREVGSPVAPRIARQVGKGARYEPLRVPAEEQRREVARP
jgi:hypothetical protein